MIKVKRKSAKKTDLVFFKLKRFVIDQQPLLILYQSKINSPQSKNQEAIKGRKE